MKAKEFNEQCRSFLNETRTNYADLLENMSEQLPRFGNVFNYAANCERNFELNLREDYERKTTFTSDLSIAEWCAVRGEGINAVLDTIYRAMTQWRDDIEYFAELIIAVNMKSWEHNARGNGHWSALYAQLYYYVKDMFFDWYDETNKKHDEAMNYYYDYVD